jgi:hypothetical protein
MGHEVGRAGAGPEQGREMVKEGKQAAGGEKWAEPETERGRGNLFPFYFSSFYSNLLKRICKTNLN